jgi:hypothetical protein
MTLRSTFHSLIGAALLTAASVPLHAQVPPTDSVLFARAQQMVAEGNGAAGRAMVDLP